jgi:uncharacterized protein with PIN domain/sulfur carrier protein ThiS
VAAAPGLDAPPEGSAAEVELRLYAELQDFLPADRRGGPVRRPHRPHQTVKDLIEAVGVPHSEVELVVVEGEVVDFSHRPAAGDRIAVYPAFRRLDLGPLPRLHPPWPEQPRFAADVHLGRLARLLRLLGFDVRWANDLDDDELAAVAEAEGRVVLTADRGLLKRNQVVHGVFVRPGDAVEQAVEVLRRLDLGGRLAPFTRCLVCGGELDEVPKAAVLDRLEPLTRRHHDRFRRCGGCDRIYWPGSHHERLAATVAEVRARLGGSPGGSGAGG